MTDIQERVMFKLDKIKDLGEGAKKEYTRLCKRRGISSGLYEYHLATSENLEVCDIVWRKWHTTKKFKVGDKVYVVPSTPTTVKYCIRATITEIGKDGWGYRLRAFKSDLPSIYMFNAWDKDLQIRVNKSKKTTPKELLI